MVRVSPPWPLNLTLQLTQSDGLHTALLSCKQRSSSSPYQEQVEQWSDTHAWAEYRSMHKVQNRKGTPPPKTYAQPRAMRDLNLFVRKCPGSKAWKFAHMWPPFPTVTQLETSRAITWTQVIFSNHCSVITYCVHDTMLDTFFRPRSQALPLKAYSNVENKCVLISITQHLLF